MNFKGLIFDLDGTLIDSMNVWTEIDAEFLKEYNIDMPVNFYEDIKDLSFADTAIYFSEKLGIPMNSKDIMDKFNAMAREKYEKIVPLKKGVYEFIEREKKKGTKLCVATANNKELTILALKRLGIYDSMEFILTCDEICSGKGTPDIYIKCAEKMGFEISETVVFEDILRGVLSAKSAGFYVVAVKEETAFDDIDEIKKNCDLFIEDYTCLIDK